MKFKTYLVVSTFILFLISNLYARETINFNDNWKFYLGDPENAQFMDYDDSGWSEISLPHDWAISQAFDHNLPANTGKLPWKGVGWYRKNFELDPKQEGQQIYLIFDGIMAFPKVYINGQFAGEWDYGYNSFYLNVTELISFSSPNLIAVKADTRNHDSRWYPGAGIYRKIQMLITDPVHVDIWGTYITTPVVNSEMAEVKITTTVNNTRAEDERVTLVSQIFDPEGNMIVEMQSEKTVLGNGSIDIEQVMNVNNPNFWDINNPYLYKAKTIIKTDTLVRDVYKSTFGVRTIEFQGN